MNQGRKKRRLWVELALLALPLVILLCVAVLGYRWLSKSVATAGNAPAAVTISKETTYITAPLRPDGYPDYVAALNQIASQGVTPENNAVVLLIRALGPGEMSPPVRKRYFKLLGMEPLPETGDYLVDVNAWISRLLQAQTAADSQAESGKSEEELCEELERIIDRPWTKEEFPHWARWLEENEQALELVVAASRRPRHYSPLVSMPSEVSPPLFAVIVEVISSERDAARALRSRAMYRLGTGDVAGAWGDLLACHRLARLMGQDPMLIALLVSSVLDQGACKGDARVIEYGDLSAEQARQMLADLQSLGPLPSIAEKFDLSERYMFLDTACALARGDIDVASVVTGSRASGLKSLASAIQRKIVDWDEVLRTGNAQYDRVVGAMKEPEYRKSKRALEKLNDELRAKQLVASQSGVFLQTTEKFTHALLVLLLAPPDSMRSFQERGQARFELAKLGFALAAYRAEHGEWPEKLEALVPDYLAELPDDPFTDRPFHYRREGEGFLLYSVGPNLRDNGGKNKALDVDDSSEEWLPESEDWDDVRLRIPDSGPLRAPTTPGAHTQQERPAQEGAR